MISDSGHYSSPPTVFETIPCNSAISLTMTPKYAFLVATVTLKPPFTVYNSYLKDS